VPVSTRRGLNLRPPALQKTESKDDDDDDDVVVKRKRLSLVIAMDPLIALTII